MTSEKITIGKGTQYPLDGRLTLPDNLTNPVPAVVFVHGSGSSNMDEKVGKLTPFKDLAEGLANHGIASVRYDKRPYKYGFKMVRHGGITVREEAIEDAILARKLLENDSRIDKDNIFIVGHSMGAMLAPRIDAEGGNFKGLILMAGTLRTLKEVLEDQTADMLSHMKGILKWLTEKQVKKIMKGFDGLENITDDEAKKRKFGNGVTMYYFKEMDSFPTAECLKNTEKPVLVMQGDKDFQCKADVDFAGYKALLEGRENVTFRLYENLNHCFVPSVYGIITKAKQEYNKEQHIGEKVIADMAEWIKGAI